MPSPGPATRAALVLLCVVAAAPADLASAQPGGGNCAVRFAAGGRVQCFWNVVGNTAVPSGDLPPTTGCTLDDVADLGCTSVDHLIDRAASNPAARAGAYNLT